MTIKQKIDALRNMTDEEQDELMKVCVGRIFKMMSSEPQKDDEKIYKQCEWIVMTIKEIREATI